MVVVVKLSSHQCKTNEIHSEMTAQHGDKSAGIIVFHTKYLTQNSHHDSFAPGCCDGNLWRECCDDNARW